MKSGENKVDREIVGALPDDAFMVRRGRRLISKAEARALLMHENGADLASITTRTGLSPDAVMRVLADNGSDDMPIDQVEQASEAYARSRDICANPLRGNFRKPWSRPDNPVMSNPFASWSK